MARGGKRIGAGRPVISEDKKAKNKTFKLYDWEVEPVKEFIKKMRGKLILISLLMSVCLPAFSYTVESKPVLDQRNSQGIGVAYYAERGEIEYDTTRYKYQDSSVGSKLFYERYAKILSHPLLEMQANGRVYRDPGVRVKVPESRTSYNALVGWSLEDYGTIVEYDIERATEILRKYVYALDGQERVTKYKITEANPKNPLKRFWSGSYDVYTPVSYFVQTKVGEKPKNNQTYRYDKNGKMLPFEKQTKFSEIAEYDMNGNILSIYRKDEWDRIKEYESDGKTLRTFHDTKYLPYLQWSEEDGKRIYKSIDMFQAKLFDTEQTDFKTLLNW